MQYRAVGSGDVRAVKSDGTVVTPDENGFVTLTAATYYFLLDGAEGSLVSAQIKTDATIAGTFIVQTCNFPKYVGGGNDGQTSDVTDYSGTTGDWITEDPTTAYVGTTGTGWTVTNLSLAKTAGAGGAMLHLGNLGSKRTRLRFTVTTGGTVRVNRHAKGGAG